ncbi:MAG: adenylate/guanylate cyclase domain-containing protein [Gammaproteobacteria bacterium]|nr:adenylate/guanylate cyclase domain-containing protein [Gammaproteobacteria bacterium]
MAKDRLSGKLAVILHADIADSTALVQQDERLAHERIQDAFRRLSETIEKFQGHVRELRGDALLADFERPSDAVTAALAFQAEHTSYIDQLSDDIRPAARVGIAMGEVIIADSTVTGAGVVLAQRVEQLSEPGGVCITAAIHEGLPKRLPFNQADMGERQVKGFDEPVRVYAVSLKPGGVISSPEALAQTESAAPALPEKPSIAVLPFDNMSGDSEQDFFADGISEDLITALSKIHWFFVIARNSSFTYKGRAVDVTRVAGELGVRYVIEGSVRKAGNRIRISAQLIDATTGRHVWAERYDRSLVDIFELQDEMTQTIVGAVEPELSAAEREQAARKPPENLGAWETYQRGLWHLWNFNKDDVAEAQRLFRQVHELDPTFGTPYAYEAYCHYLGVILGYAKVPEENLEKALTAAKKALALDHKDPVAYLALGRVYTMLGEHDASVAANEKALELSPSFYLAYHGLGFALALSGQLEESAKALDKAIRLSPRDALLWGTMSFRSLTCNLLQQYEAAADWARKSILEPRAVGGGYWSYTVLASALGNLDQTTEAREAVEEALHRKPDLSLAFLETTLPTKQPGGLEIFIDGLRKAGLTD